MSYWARAQIWDRWEGGQFVHRPRRSTGREKSMHTEVWKDIHKVEQGWTLRREQRELHGMASRVRGWPRQSVGVRHLEATREQQRLWLHPCCSRSDGQNLSSVDPMAIGTFPSGQTKMAA